MAGKGGLAEQIRAGLENDDAGTNLQATATRGAATSRVLDPLDELYFRKPIRVHVRETFAVLATILLAVAAYKIWRRSDFVLGFGLSGAAVIIVLCGYLLPRMMLPVWRGLIKVAAILERVMSTVILVLAWTLMMVPMAFILRILGVKVMDTTFRLPVETYWETRDKKYDNFKRLELQY